MNKKYQVCTRCVMDTTDSEIQFDENGVCNHCRRYDDLARKRLLPPKEAEKQLQKIVADIKISGRNKDYDCVLGVSGGVDSTFAAYQARKMGLRVLAVHLDNGWNSELAVANIEKTIKKLGIDLYTYVIDWDEFKDLQLSFLKASVSDGEIPSDHAIFATIYKVAAKQKIDYILNPVNFVSESILPRSWTYGIGDWRYIKNVHNLFGSAKIKSFPHYSLLTYQYYTVFRKIKSVPILNYLQYNKKEALRLLEKELEWKYYGGKHYESIYTRFFQGYILPEKFNIDKRKAHLSNLICSGQITRDEALEELKKPIYPIALLEEDKEFVNKKFNLSEKSFQELMRMPVKNHRDYRTYEPIVQRMTAINSTLKKFGFGFRKPIL